MEFSFGAHESPIDPRTIKHEEMATLATPLIARGGYEYLPTDIEHQHNVGICTAISLTQNAAKYIGHKFSADFQYLLQKKFIDGNWDEGSSIFAALKVGKNYGFLPVELFTYITEADRNLPYEQYLAKLKAIPDSEIQRLIALCSDYKLDGYAQVDVSNSSNISTAILSSKSGILCRYEVGKEWYTASDGHISWIPADINPLRPPQTIISGHAITGARFDYTVNLDLELANTWGASWNREGLGDTNLSIYAPTEAWIPYYGLTDEQLNELKAKLQAQVGILQKIIGLYLQIKSILKPQKSG